MFPESWTSSGCPEVRSLQWTAIDPWLEGSICYFIEPLLQTGSAHRLHDFPQWIFSGNCGTQNRPPVCHTGTVRSFNPLRRSYSTVFRDPQGRPVVSLNTSGVACWLSFWISLCFVTILGIPLSPPAIVTSFGTIEPGLECHIALKAHGQQGGLFYRDVEWIS